MEQDNIENVTFQVTVGQLTLSTCLSKLDIRVTIHVENVSKITCSGKLSKDGLRVTWNHSFLFTANPSTNIKVAICILPEELTTKWNKQAFGDQMVISVASLLECENGYEYSISGVDLGHATLSLICRASNMLITQNNHDCQLALSKDGWRLYNFGKQLKNVACMSTYIEVNLARLDLCPLGHAKHIYILNDLGLSFQFRYNQMGDLSDLNKAMELFQMRLELCPSGHPAHSHALGTYAMSLWKHYCIQRSKEDLYRLINLQERWLVLCPSDHPDHRRALGAYAKSLWERYRQQGDEDALNRAIQLAEKGLCLCPIGHPQHGLAIGSLAAYLKARYQRQGNMVDLNKAIELQEEDLKLCSPDHPEYGTILLNLSLSLQESYTQKRDSSDLVRAIELAKNALNAYPVQHYHFPLIVKQLAAVILLPFKSSQRHCLSDENLPSQDEAFQTYKLLKACSPAVSLNLLEAIQDWIQDAERQNHSSILEAYQTLFNTLDHFTTLSSSLDSRHEAMQARVADLANDAFSCAARHGNLYMAVELLEQGRGILWNQLARFDISLAALEGRSSQEWKLGRKFTRLSTDLRKHAERSGSSTDSYWRTMAEWQTAVEKIRGLDGFSRFLLPPRFVDLQQAAIHGPIIIVNASKRSCDALIVLHARTPVHVPLPCSRSDVEQLSSQLLVLTCDAHAYETHRESYVKEMMRELWSSVVEPIVAVLQDEVQLPLGARIWWCPTSKFTTLPFHAAGPHRKAEKNIFDIYVSSYAPSLSTLIRTQERIRSQQATHAVVGTEEVISFAAIGQGQPRADTKLSQLQVEHEIQRIRDETGVPPSVKFESITGSAATIEGTVQAFRDHRWVHIACHGAQHAEKPFDSWFAMGDGKLTLMRIIQERYSNSEFAFLSACHTAVGDASTPDEVLHLAAGMQFAGFNGVIGTLWRVDDVVAHQVVTRFYKEMFKRPDVRFERAAEALNTAVVETANEVSLEKRIVFVHIGI